ncbi:MAG: hypothetical protein ACERKN_18080 [Velocimicrobium sp.]
MEKFKYANAFTNDAFKNIFGLRSTSPEWNIMQGLYIYRRSNLNESEFLKFFRIRDTHFSYLEKFRNNDFTQVFRKELHYCPKCMQLGYHSYLHQLSFIDSCPFHGEQLLCLSYNSKAVPYSIDFTPTEAYSVMQEREKQPAERFIDILPSRKLIDGIWQLTPDYIKIDESPIYMILFFNPSIEPSEPVKSTKCFTLKLVDCLINNMNTGFEPFYYIDKKSSISEYNDLLTRSEEWFASKYQVFHKSNLKSWFIAKLIEELIQNIDKDVLRYSISNMQLCQYYYKIDSEQYLKAATAVTTAYIVSNARNLYEGIDNSIVYHYWTHNKVNRCTFSIFDIESYINSKGILDRYLPFLIFKRLFRKLYDHIFTVLQGDIDLSFNYSNIMEFNVPDYIIAQKDNRYEIFEIEDD